MASPDLIGRDNQLAELLAAAGVHGASTASDSRIVLVCGDAGVGKTRFLREAVAIGRKRGLLAAIGSCAQQAPVLCAPLAEAMRGLLACLPGLSDPVALITASASAPGAESVEQWQPSCERALRMLIELAEQQPLLLVFDDLHLADAPTRDLIAFLGRNLHTAPITLVLSYRADELHRRHPLRPVLAEVQRSDRTQRLELTGLGKEEIRRLIESILARPADDSVVDALLARTAGNPFHIEELVASGQLMPGTAGCAAETVLARVSRLPLRVQAALRAACVGGDRIDETLIAEVAGEPAEEMTVLLRKAAEHHLVVFGDDGCWFRHSLIREALYEDLLPGECDRLRRHHMQSQASGGAGHSGVKPAVDLPTASRTRLRP